MPAVQHLILATAGHVDHGKSALVLSLTGTDPDRLPEEKRRGITIDLGFAPLVLNTPDAEYHLGIIDVPGHEDFVKNMVAGVGSIDLALLVVAADDGWMPQTEEHLQILQYLGVSHGVVALTKSDLVADVPAAAELIRQRLRGSTLAEAPIVPTAAPSGVGIEALKTTLAAVLSKIPPRADTGKPRLAIDRVFSSKGVGTVVTGTLTGGAIARGQTLSLLPAGTTARVRAMQTHHHDVAGATPGCRVALNLPDLRDVRRGDVITLPGIGSAPRVLDVLLRRSDRLDMNTPALKTGTRVWFHHGSAAVEGRVRLLENTPLAPGGSGLARLLLQRPAAILVGDRFILRDGPEQRTLAGGVVLDPAPPGGARRRPREMALLTERAAAPDSAEVCFSTQLRRDGVITRAGLGTNTPFAAPLLLRSLDQAVSRGRAVAFGDSVADIALWERARSSVVLAVDAHHAAHPDESGAPLTALRSAVAAALPPHLRAVAPLLTGAVGEALAREGFVRTATTLRRGSHRPRLPDRLEPAARLIRQQLEKRPLEPPSRKELTPTDLAQQALRFMIAGGEVIEIGPDAVLSAAAYGSAVETIRLFLRAHGPATVAALKERLGSSRRIVVPLLEKLDKEKITLRQGDLRVAR